MSANVLIQWGAVALLIFALWSIGHTLRRYGASWGRLGEIEPMSDEDWRDNERLAAERRAKEEAKP